MSSTNKANSTFVKVYRRIQSLALVFMLLIGIAPVILAAIPGTSSNDSFSIYSEAYDGLSFVRENLEAVETDGGTSKYNVTNVVSNLNILNRFNGSGTLVIVGPSSDFGLTETISIILYMLRGGSIIVVDDFGSANQILAPIFDAFSNIDTFSEQASEQGFEVPTVSDIFSGQSGESGGESEGGDDSFGIGDGGSSSDSVSSEDFMVNLIGDLIRAFGFNTTGILMDINSNSGSPARPVITDFYDTEIPGYTFTQNIDAVAMEMGSIISVKLSVPIYDDFGNKLDANGEVTTNSSAQAKKIVWQPLQKISASLINENFDDDAFSLPVPFFPMYSSKFSWIETDFSSAAAGTMEPDVGEWGNANFATALSIPMFPGFGKLIFLSDPSIFINRYTQQTDLYDNMNLILNLVDMATYDQEITADNPQIPILFDFGHTFQSLSSPALYTTALLKLIAEISMFPLYAPFVPYFMYGYGKRIMPSNRRLRPILLTKRRGETGHSDFEAKLEQIKEESKYGEPIMYLSKRIIRKVRKDVRFEGVTPKNPRELAKFFRDNFKSSVGREAELRVQLAQIFKVAENPNRKLGKISAKKQLDLLKKLDDLLGT
ncbi:MAG: hypothetical protein CME83_00245 [Candidatus Heimdallarchaeota archaeon]|nr:hypothetical protein [Candidatus Heimdallarchaeota archaeon]